MKKKIEFALNDTIADVQINLTQYELALVIDVIKKKYVQLDKKKDMYGKHYIEENALHKCNKTRFFWSEWSGYFWLLRKFKERAIWYNLSLKGLQDARSKIKEINND